MVYPTWRDHNDRYAVQEAIEFMVFARQFGDGYVQDKHREHRYDTVGNGDRGVGHRYAGKLRNDEGDDELEGLQFRQLSLAHQPHDE